MIQQIFINHNHDISAVGGSCPKCSSPLAVRKGRGSSGSYFLGCTEFPKCRGTRNISGNTIALMIDIAIELLPALVSIIDSPDFLRGEYKTLNDVHEIATGYSAEFGKFVFDQGLNDWVLLQLAKDKAASCIQELAE